MSDVTISREYLQTTGSVLRAGRRLQHYLETDKSKVQFAVADLEIAGFEHGNQSTGYQRFLFAGIETAAPATGRELTEDLLASVLADVQTANVLIAAGQAAGETGRKGDPALLGRALDQLEDVQQNLENAATSGTAPGRFGFGGLPAAEDTSVTTREGLAERAYQTLDGLVHDAESVVLELVQRLDKIGAGKIGDALSALAEQSSALQGIGRLFAQGLAKLRGAIDSLLRLLGGKALDAVRERAEKFWQDLKDGKLIPGLLEWAFDVETTRQLVKATLAAGRFDATAIGKAGADLSELAIRFRESMGLARRLCSGVALAAGVLALSPMAPQSAAIGAGVYGLILAGVVLIGMDYADSGRVFNRVRGVGRVIADLGRLPVEIAAGTV